MSSPESSESAIRNLRAQVRHLEDTVLVIHAELERTREQKAMFETAAGERLVALQRGEELFQAKSRAAVELEEEAIRLRESLRIAREAHAALEAELAALSVDLQEVRATAAQDRLDLETAHAEALAAECARTAAAEAGRREASRGSEELALRERTLTRQLLELRSEGLLHSIVRRVRNLFS